MVSGKRSNKFGSGKTRNTQLTNSTTGHQRKSRRTLRKQSVISSTPSWLVETGPSDWLFDGLPMRGPIRERWHHLDWANARLDMGPSPAGNLGPYWHVPLRKVHGRWEGDTIHRLYPKLGKWLPMIREMIAQRPIVFGDPRFEKEEKASYKAAKLRWKHGRK